MSKPLTIQAHTFGAGRPLICVPLIGRTTDDILAAARQLKDVPAQVVEWRSDYFEEIANLGSVVAILDLLHQQMHGKLLLFTFRSKKEGGVRHITDEDYYTLCRVVCQTGWTDLIDLELSFGEEMVSKLTQEAKQNNVYTILSKHDFSQTPDFENLTATMLHMKELQADLVKVAVMPQNNADVLTLLAATASFSAMDEYPPCITMAMGDLGKISRIAGETFGSCMTFGVLTEASAPGQIDAVTLRNMLETLAINKPFNNV